VTGRAMQREVKGTVGSLTCQLFALYAKFRTADAISCSVPKIKNDPFFRLVNLSLGPPEQRSILQRIWNLPECKKIEGICGAIWALRKQDEDGQENVNSLSHDTAHRFVIEMGDKIDFIVAQELNDKIILIESYVLGTLDYLLSIEIDPAIFLPQNRICHFRQMLYYLYSILKMLEMITPDRPSLNGKFWSLVDQLKCFEFFSAIDLVVTRLKPYLFLSDDLLPRL
jgi:hypothetical protein